MNVLKFSLLSVKKEMEVKRNEVISQLIGLIETEKT